MIGQSDFCQTESLIAHPILTVVRPGAIQALFGPKSTHGCE
jgi:hypothetical protein